MLNDVFLTSVLIVGILKYITLTDDYGNRIPFGIMSLDHENLSIVRFMQAQLIATDNEIALVGCCVQSLASHLEQCGLN